MADAGAGSGPAVDMLGRPVAPHVPTALIRSIDFWHGPGMDRDPFGIVRALRDGPRMLYNTHNPIKGQSWLPTKGAEIRYILTNAQLFSSTQQADFSGMIGEDWPLIPVEIDPPAHGQFRRLVERWFTPQAVEAIGARVGLRAVELIEAVARDGGCDFKEAFGTPFPVSIFMEVMGLPVEDMPVLRIWAWQIMQGTNEEKKIGLKAAVAYMRDLIAQRRRAPKDDLISGVTLAELDGKPIAPEHVLGICVLLFIGGLDTVVGTLGLAFNHLASNPDYQSRLRADPDAIPRAVDEYLRLFSPAQSQRQATTDVAVGGVEIRAGDWVTIVDAFASLDPEEFDDPDSVRLDRGPVRHMAFSTGPHVCLGRHLARRELATSLREWLTRIPPFRITPGEHAVSHGGNTFGMERLPLSWDVQEATRGWTHRSC
jgi:cytochrome P450